MISRIVMTLLVLAAGAFAQQNAKDGGLMNATVQTHDAAAGLQRTFDEVRRAEPNTWIAYSVPVVDGERTMCCWNTWEDVNKTGRGRCRLDGSGQHTVSGNVQNDRMPPVERDRFYLTYRIENGAIAKVRSFSCDCSIDAGGAKVHVLQNVKPAESVALLMGWIESRTSQAEGRKDASRQAIDAIGLHADASAETALEKLLAQGNPEWVRKHTAFWYAHTRPEKAVPKLKAMMAGEASASVRKELVFPLAQTKLQAGFDELVRVAKSDSDSRVRGEAIFWLAQEAGKRAIGPIEDAIANDPDTDVKKKAVFALSQLPKDEGVPRLIEIARTHRNPVVRKQAFFWLGDSRDPRALAFLEEILRK